MAVAFASASVAMPSIASAGSDTRMVAYAGGHTASINRYAVNSKTGALTFEGTTDTVNSATWMVTDPNGDVLYVANVIGGKTAPHPEGNISAYLIDKSDGSLSLINSAGSGGSNPAHVSIHPSGKWALVANYGAKGNASGAVIAINADGSVGDVVQKLTIKNDPPKLGVTPAIDASPLSFAISGHDMPHAHHFEIDPSGKYALLTDLATDRTYVYSFDAETGQVTPTVQGAIAETDGAGPRTIAFHDNGKWVYVSNEEASTASFMTFDSSTGELTHQQTIQSLPDGFEGTNFASHIEVSPNGEYVWMLDRLHDSIAIFKIGNDGTLTREGEFWTRGAYPFQIAVDPTDRFIYIAHLRSDNVTTMKILDGGADFEMVGYNGVRSARSVKVVALD